MKITKRITKEVHNEKVKSFDEGFEKGKTETINKVKEIIKLSRIRINYITNNNQEIDNEIEELTKKLGEL